MGNRRVRKTMAECTENYELQRARLLDNLASAELELARFDFIEESKKTVAFISKGLEITPERRFSNKSAMDKLYEAERRKKEVEKMVGTLEREHKVSVRSKNEPRGKFE